MKRDKETALLRTINIIPILIIALFSTFIIIMMISYHGKHIKESIINMQNENVNLNKFLSKNEVNKIFNIIQAQYNTNETSRILSKERMKLELIKLIESIKYDIHGYIFLVNGKGEVLVSFKKNILIQNKTYDEEKFVNAIEKIMSIKNKSGESVSYLSIPGTHLKQSKKISYIKYFEPYDWYIGYGFHPDDIQSTIDANIAELKKEHKKQLYKLIFITIFATFILSAILISLSRKIENLFKTYKEKIDLKEQENIRQNEIIYQQSKMTVIGELLNLISHQWRQPLSQINSITLNMYIEQQSGILDKIKLKQNINDIENTTQYLSQTIDDFSNFFVQESKEKVFYVNDAIEHCISIINPSLHHIDLQLNFCKHIQINGYRTLFQQIILSLISNCIDAFNTNHIIKPNIIITTKEENEFIIIELSDNGGGVMTEYLEKIFEIYFSTKNNEVASGLGLYIVKKIVEKNFKGTICANDIPNGVKFTIRIKCYDNQ